MIKFIFSIKFTFMIYFKNTNHPHFKFTLLYLYFFGGGSRPLRVVSHIGQGGGSSHPLSQ